MATRYIYGYQGIFERWQMKVSEVANGIIHKASAAELKNLQTLKTICNSDTAFVAAVKKYQAYQKLLQKAFLLSRTWQKLGQARTWKITIKALQAAFVSMATSFQKLAVSNDFPDSLKNQISRFIQINSVQLEIPA